MPWSWGPRAAFIGLTGYIVMVEDAEGGRGGGRDLARGGGRLCADCQFWLREPEKLIAENGCVT